MAEQQQMKVDTSEARLITMYREIKRFEKENEEELVDTSDVGDFIQGLENVVKIEKKEADLTGPQLKAMFYGFVAGVASSRLAQLAASGMLPIESQSEFDEYEEQLPDEVANMTVSGGPSGGVVAGQGTDPRFVTQTGPQE